MSGQAGAPGSPRGLGFWPLFTLGVNGIVGVGIFLAPAELAKVVPGPASALSFVTTALLLLPVAWTYGRLGSAFHEDGGPFVWAREALGERIAFGVGFVAYVSAALSTAAVVSALGHYLAPELGFHSDLARWIFQLAVALLFSIITLLGLRLSAWVWSLLTLLKLVPLLLLAGVGLRALVGQGIGVASAPSGQDLARAALLAVFPLQGFEIVPVPAAEARAGRGRMLAATLLSLGFAAVLYGLIQLACVRALPQLARSTAPVVDAAQAALPGFGRAWFAAGANVSALGIAFGMFAMTPRYLAALGTPSLFGTWLARQQRGVPVLAVAVTTLAVVVLVSSSALLRLIVLSSLAVLLQYGVAAIALFRLAARGERGLGRLDRILAPLTLVALGVLLQAAEPGELLTIVGIWACGVALLVGRRAAR